MSTFEIKMTILSILGDKSEVDNAQELYEWVMQEVEVKEEEGAEVSHLTTVQ